jgi:hypothetical protein
VGAVAAAVQPVSNTTCVLPVAEIAYIDLSLSVVVDRSGRFKFLPGDSVSLTDLYTFVLSRPLSDVVAAATDDTFVSALKVLADAFGMNDGSEAFDGATYSFSKGIQNVAFATDAVATSLAKLNEGQDQIALLDSAVKILSRPLFDSAGVADNETIIALKALSDSAELQDVVALVLVVIREFNDAVDAIDAESKLFTPAVKVEQIEVADDDTIDVQKALADGFAMNDGSETVDGSVYSFAKGISNVAFVADEDSLIFTTSRVESADVADAGLVSAQNYCDVSYFAQDYVGVSQSF